MQNRLERFVAALARVPYRFLTLNSLLFGGLGVSQPRPIDSEDATTVHGSLESPQGAVDRFVLSKLDPDCQCKYLFKTKIVNCSLP